MEKAQIIAISALCILLAAATFITPIFNFFNFNTSDHANLLNAASTISANILSSIFTVFIFIKFGINEIIKKLEKSYEIKNLTIKMNNAFDFWNVPSKHKEQIIIYGENGKQEKLKAENPDHHCPAPSINTVKAFREIYATIKEITHDTNESIHLKHINEIETSLLDENNKQNIVLLGGVKSLIKITPTTLQESQLQINQTVTCPVLFRPTET